MKITKQMLLNNHACSDQVQLFVDTFGDVVEVTEASCLKAATVHLDILWAANNLFNDVQIAAYEEAEEPLWAAYKKSEAPLLAAYEEAEEPLWAAYEEARALAFYKSSCVK